ncbi:MAG: type IV pilus modification PilV family protein [Solirubrobacteraceae bacterium]
MTVSATTRAASGPARRLIRSARAEEGVLLVEVLVAIVVLTAGILVLLTSFSGSERLTLTAEVRNSAAHRAQGEIERLETLPYTELAMTSAPTRSTESTSPDYYVDYGTSLKCNSLGIGCYAWNYNALGEEEPLVPATSGACGEPAAEGCGVVSASPTPWSDGRLSGEIYDFVTWASDPICSLPESEKPCHTENDYKRITVVATINRAGATRTRRPVRISTVIANPNATPAEGTPSNPLKSPGTTCGKGEACTVGISGNAQTWFLHDSSAAEDEAGKALIVPSSSNETHATVAPSNATSCTSTEHSGCPRPDLMSAAVPTATHLYDYSSDQNPYGTTITGPAGDLEWTCPGELDPENGLCFGGRRLQRGVECGVEPSESEAVANLKSEMWVSEPFAAASTLTGAGGLSLYSQTVSGTQAPATLCVAIYRVPPEIDALWTSSAEAPKLIGWTSYTPPSGADWPSSLEEVSFSFEPGGARELIEGTTVVKSAAIAAGERIGLRIWPAGASGADIAVAYDTAGRTETVSGVEEQVSRYPALLQLNTE